MLHLLPDAGPLEHFLCGRVDAGERFACNRLSGARLDCVLGHFVAAPLFRGRVIAKVVA